MQKTKLSVTEVAEEYGWKSPTTAIKYVKEFEQAVDDGLINRKYFLHPNRKIKKVNKYAFEYYMTNRTNFQDPFQCKKLTEYKF
ncbi:hypothetical protein [Peptostreptococcus equinus]|uniref:DNA-binding protein n=1 Tax=Peptostreptococcus equinus TaxID=3003601 RepID=A0ABY7JN95_9FIRM|nr:hypothetical protein [Peptostreptococcus sp. CBA3647]WAW14644.1 hypothetical protein O0R46_08575 [Peptostreptococcus sp. CBA3647]